MFRASLLALLCCSFSITSFAETISPSKKAVQIIEVSGFDAAFSNILVQTVRRTQTYPMVGAKCPFRVSRLLRQGISNANEAHFGTWQDALATHLTATFGQEFLVALPISDQGALIERIEQHPSYNTFLAGLEDVLQPVLADATTTVVTHMWEACAE